MKRGTAILAASVIALSGLVASALYLLMPIPVTVCELADNPAKYRWRSLRVPVRVESDGFEYLLAADDRCPMTRLRLRYSDEFAKSAALERINGGIGGVGVGTSKTDIRGEFHGEVTFDEHAEPYRQWTLIVDGVDKLMIEHLKHERQSPFPELR